MTRCINAILAAAVLLSFPGLLHAQATSYTVTVVPPDHGKVQLTPALASTPPAPWSR